MNALTFAPQKLRRIVLAGLIGCGATAGSAAWAAEETTPVDFSRARQLRQKQQEGATLTPEERAELQRAMATREKAGAGQGSGRRMLQGLSAEEQAQVREIMRKREQGETLTEAERALALKVRRGNVGEEKPAPISTAATGASRKPAEPMVPLPEMTGGQRYAGQDGGLYGEGRNEPPPAHLEAARAAAAQIVPRGPGGEPARNGKVVLLGVGMSNTTQEFSRFKEVAEGDAAKAKHVVIVDGAQGGQAAAEWIESADGRIWQTVEARLKSAGVTAAQVQAVWLKQANKRPTEGFPAHTKKLEADLAQLVQMLKAKFPHLQVVYLSSRTYGGYAGSPLNPEPYAYESAFAVRDLVRRQIAGDRALNSDAKKGPVRAPVLLWGPYLWANGETPRAGDGLVWRREDFAADGTHPSASGRDKVAQMLLTFLKKDPTARGWFTAAGATAEPAR